MATKSSAIQKKIETLKKGLNNKFITAAQKEKIKAQVEKLQTQAKASAPKKASKPAATSLTRLQKMVNKKKYGIYKGAGVDLQKDSDRPAKAIGKRTSKSGKTYYEYRANRIDVKQPPKRYPKLEKGGYMADGGEIYSGKDIKITIPKMGKFDEQKVVAVYDKDNFIFKIYDKDKKRVLTKMGGINFESNLINGLYKIDGYMAKGGELAAKKRLEELREELRAERISYGELAELQELSEYIDKDDVELLEAAGFPENDEDEYGKGGYVAVSEKNDYWTIITKPTTKEKAQEMLDLGGLPRGEVGKVVTLEEAKAHKNTIGKEYLEKGGYFAKGGAIEHGLMVGDTVRDVAENSVAIYNVNNRKSFVVDLDKGTRTEWIGSFKDRKKYAEKGAYMAMGGEMHRTQE